VVLISRVYRSEMVYRCIGGEGEGEGDGDGKCVKGEEAMT
jgi:hypothetical protein